MRTRTAHLAPTHPTMTTSLPIPTPIHTPTSPTDPIERDAIEFGAHSAPTRNWRLGLLVARNVKESRPGRPSIIRTSSVFPKVTAMKFGSISGVSDRTISWHLKAWDLAAADKDLVPPIPFSKDLAPDDEVVEFPPASRWTRYYNLARYGTETAPKPTPRTKPAPAPEPGPGPVPEEISVEPEPEPAAAESVEEPEPESEPEPTPEPRRGRPRVKGEVTFAKIERMKAARVTNPDATKSEIAKIADLSGHQEVRVLELIDAAPPEFKQMIQDDELRLAVAQEILEAPMFTPDQQIKLARKFTAGTFSQVGQAKTTIRPIVAFVQTARPAIQDALLDEVELTIEQAKDQFPQFGLDEESRAKTKAKAEAEGVNPMLWATNFSTSISKQRTADEVALTRLTESFHAADAMRAFDPFLMSHTVKDMQAIRELLIKRYEELERWIVTLVGSEQVNHPHRTTTDTATITVDAVFEDAPEADVIDFARQRASRINANYDGVVIDG